MIKYVYLKILKLSSNQHLMKGVQVDFLHMKLLHIKKSFYYLILLLTRKLNVKMYFFLKNNSPNQLFKKLLSIIDRKMKKINKTIIYKESKIKEKLGNFLFNLIEKNS